MRCSLMQIAIRDHIWYILSFSEGGLISQTAEFSINFQNTATCATGWLKRRLPLS